MQGSKSNSERGRWKKRLRGESEVEVYADPNKSYAEIEQQVNTGFFSRRTRWYGEVKWFLRKIPGGVPRETRSQSLVFYAREIVK